MGRSTVAHFARKVRATDMLRKMFGLAPRRPPKNRPPHFARKVRATDTSRKMFVVAPRAPPKESSPSLCEQSELQCWRRKNSINSNLRRPRCPKPRFQPFKIAKRLVRNCRAKKCCIFSLKCLDVNNLIHNFVTQDRLHLGKAYKQACKLCSRFTLSLPPKPR